MVTFSEDELKYLNSILNNHIIQMENLVLFDETAQKKSLEIAKNLLKKIGKAKLYDDSFSDAITLNSQIIADELHFLSKGKLTGKLKLLPAPWTKQF